MTNPIYFYSAGGAYGEFSNFYRHPLVLHEGKERRYTFDTSEHFFQMMKFIRTDPAWALKVWFAGSPGDAAAKGRDRKHPIDPKWDKGVSQDVMRLAVLRKFGQSEELARVLLSTGDRKLVEHTHKDRIWADGGDGSGENWLGRILMEVRGVLLDRQEYREGQGVDPVDAYIRKHRLDRWDFGRILPNLAR